MIFYESSKVYGYRDNNTKWRDSSTFFFYFVGFPHFWLLCRRRCRDRLSGQKGSVNSHKNLKPAWFPTAHLPLVIYKIFLSVYKISFPQDLIPILEQSRFWHSCDVILLAMMSQYKKETDNTTKDSLEFYSVILLNNHIISMTEAVSSRNNGYPVKSPPWVSENDRRLSDTDHRDDDPFSKENTFLSSSWLIKGDYRSITISTLQVRAKRVLFMMRMWKYAHTRFHLKGVLTWLASRVRGMDASMVFSIFFYCEVMSLQWMGNVASFRHLSHF